MFALTKFARLAAVGTVVIAAALSLPVRADDQPQNLGPVGPHEPILSPVGSKRVIAFYTPDSCHCGLRVVVWNPADVDATSTIGLRMSLIPQQVMYIQQAQLMMLALRKEKQHRWRRLPEWHSPFYAHDQLLTDNIGYQVLLGRMDMIGEPQQANAVQKREDDLGDGPVDTMAKDIAIQYSLE